MPSPAQNRRDSIQDWQRKNLHEHRPSVGLMANTTEETRQKENSICLRTVFVRMATYALRAMQCIRHLPTIHHKSLTKNSTKTWECRHGLHRRHSNCNRNNRRPHQENQRSIRVSQRGRLQDASRKMRLHAHANQISGTISVSRWN